MGARARVRQTGRGPVSLAVVNRHNRQDGFTWEQWAADVAKREREREAAWRQRQIDDNPDFEDIAA